MTRQDWRRDTKFNGKGLDLSEVVGPTHRYESLNANTDQEVDADTEGNSGTERLVLCRCRQIEVLPVEGIVDVGKYMEEMDRVKLSEAISDRIHAGKYQVEAARSQNTTSLAWLLPPRIQNPEKKEVDGHWGSRQYRMNL